MKKLLALLGVLLLVTTAMPAVSATGVPTVDTVMYFKSQSWSGLDQKSIYEPLTPLVGSETIGPIGMTIPWDGLDVISAGILVHGPVYDLTEQSGKKFMVVTKIGATDYGRGVYEEFSDPMVSGYERYGVQLNKHYYTAGKAGTVDYKVVYIVTASSEYEAEQKVEASLGASVPVVEGLFSLEAGVDYSITNVYKTSQSYTYGVEVTFHRHVYYAEIEFNGNLTRTVLQKCNLRFCPLSAKPTPSIESKTFAPELTYHYTYFRDFDLSSGMLFFIGSETVYGLGDYVIPLNFEEVKG
ncbi:hypothetical protein [Thermococcus waiotapuensis]|uniref:Uncharacterized protein n=1 Tax=Thermococcus waiotapuensis TaxID=90909 RepID=A0AAE4NV93_9EURY|nr:hypothetical protein [Thermococcus waiotapuensis]MDV3103275.1 hypothetical protein [Thermococcus waiotapuensis]